jgi:hypothetical protein
MGGRSQSRRDLRTWLAGCAHRSTLSADRSGEGWIPAKLACSTETILSYRVQL